jgi:hypothetical protein
MAQQPLPQLSGVSSVPSFGGGSESADLWLVQLRSYFLFAPNLDSNAKKICFAATRMNGQALMWFQTWLGDVEPENLQSTFAEFSDELLEHFSPAINVEHARLRLMSSSFPSGMSVEDFYSKHFLPSLLQTREPDSRDRALLFCQKLPSGMKEAVLYQNPATAAEAYKAARTYEFAYSNSTASASASALPPLPSQASIHTAELAEQIEELRASVHALSTQGRYRPGYSSAPRSAPRPAFTPRPPRSVISEEAKQRCLAERRCFNCKRPGHNVNTCRLPSSDKFPAI